MAITATYPNTDAVIGANCPPACICFEDTAYVTEGDRFSITLSVDSNPSDGDDFDFGGVTWTFRSASPGDWEILIGANANATATNMATAFNTHPEIDGERFASTGAVLALVTVVALKPGAGYALAFAAGTAAVSQNSLTPGTDTTATNPYPLNLRLLTRNTDDSTDWEAFPDLRVVPRVALDSADGAPTVTACVPVGAAAQAQATTPYPDNTGTHTFHHGPLVEMKGRWWVEGSPAVNTDPFYFIPAGCRYDDDGEGYAPWTPGYNRALKWLNHVQGGSWCGDSYPHLYAIVPETETISLVLTFDDPASPIGYSITPPYKWAVIDINVRGIVPNGYTGEVLIEMNQAISAPRVEWEEVTMNFTGGTQACCTQALRFLNNFGVWENIEVGPGSGIGVAVAAEEFTGAADCTATGGDPSELRNTAAEVERVFTVKEMDSPAVRHRLRALLASPHVYVERETSVGWVKERVRVQRGTVVYKEGATGNVQAELNLVFPERLSASIL